MNYAIIENNLVANLYVADAPLDPAHVEAGNAQIGWAYNEGTFTPPVPVAPTTQQLLVAFIGEVQASLTASDETLKRIQEAISLGTNTGTSPDVVAFVTYRRALRQLLMSQTVQTLPTKPAYPAGT